MIFERMQVRQVEINDFPLFSARAASRGADGSGVASAPAGAPPLSTAGFSGMGLLLGLFVPRFGRLGLIGSGLAILGRTTSAGLGGLVLFVGSLRRPILDVHQVTVDCQRARRESEGENLIRQRKVVF